MKDFQPEVIALWVEVERLWRHRKWALKEARRMLKSWRREKYALSGAIETAYREGWNHALDCVEVEKGIHGFPNDAQQDNGWLESDACAVLRP